MTNELTELQTLLAALDMALTGKDWTTVHANARQKRTKAEDWMGREYYLSDGGYSRIVLGIDAEKCWLTSNSTDKVKGNWAITQALVTLVLAAAVKELSTP